VQGQKAEAAMVRRGGTCFPAKWQWRRRRQEGNSSEARCAADPLILSIRSAWTPD